MKSIYDMMGKYTYPCMQEDAPREHVESFFQVSHGRNPSESGITYGENSVIYLLNNYRCLYVCEPK